MIPIARPILGEDEFAAVKEVLASGMLAQGPKVKAFEDAFAADLGRKRGVPVIEDAAQAAGAEYHGKKAGKLGVTACFSFYPTKNMTTGEGGMLVTDDDDVAARSRLLRSHGEASKYQHVALGYNYRMTEIAAAIGLVQLRKLDGWVKH